jgi:hypothetical protein
MKIRNTSEWSTAEVERLVRWAAGELEVNDYVTDVRVTAYKWGSARGLCKGHEVLIRIGNRAPLPRDVSYFPAKWPARFKNTADVVLADWREALVFIAGHEFQHSRQFRERARRRVALGVTRASRVRMSEVDADRAGTWLLQRFRGADVRAKLDDELRAAVEAEQARAAEKRERTAARNSPEALRAARITDLKNKIAAWARRSKRAATYLKKYGRALRRLERSS